MHIKPKTNHSFTCTMCYLIGFVHLPIIENCTDLGASCDASLSFTPQINKIVAMAWCWAKLILKLFSSWDSLLLTRAFCTFVRPLLEFFSFIWSLQTIFDINCRSWQFRRVKVDLLFCYKLLHGLAPFLTLHAPIYLHLLCNVISFRCVFVK